MVNKAETCCHNKILVFIHCCGVLTVTLNILFYFLIKLVVSQLVKNSSSFIESEDLLLFNSELVES